MQDITMYIVIIIVAMLVISIFFPFIYMIMTGEISRDTCRSMVSSSVLGRIGAPFNPMSLICNIVPN